MIITSSLRDIVLKQGYALGSWINSASPVIAELMASTGFDFLTVDAEHSAVDLFQTQILLQAIKAGSRSCSPLVRLPSTEKSVIQRYIDTGASGVIAPMVNSDTIAKQVVSSIKYPPIGARGVGYARSNSYGVDIDTSVVHDNERTFVCFQIEHVEGVRNLDSILSVSGVDAILIGPYDLSASMGIAGDFDNPKMVKTFKKITSLCQKHEVIAGIHVVQPNMSEVVFRIKEGFQFIAYSLDITIISEASRKFLRQIKARLKQ